MSSLEEMCSDLRQGESERNFRELGIKENAAESLCNDCDNEFCDGLHPMDRRELSRVILEYTVHKCDEYYKINKEREQ